MPWRSTRARYARCSRRTRVVGAGRVGVYLAELTKQRARDPVLAPAARAASPDTEQAARLDAIGDELDSFAGEV